MDIEDQICSLDLAKRLKELGVKQESFFYWNYSVDLKSQVLLRHDQIFHNEQDYDGLAKEEYPTQSYSAFTSAELGEGLPVGFYSGKSGVGSPWICKARRKSLFKVDDFEANARAKMLIYLLEKGLVKP